MWFLWLSENKETVPRDCTESCEKQKHPVSRVSRLKHLVDEKDMRRTTETMETRKASQTAQHIERWGKLGRARTADDRIGYHSCQPRTGIQGCHKRTLDEIYSLSGLKPVHWVPTEMTLFILHSDLWCAFLLTEVLDLLYLHGCFFNLI